MSKKNVEVVEVIAEHPEIDIVEIIEALLRKWWLVFICAVIGSGIFYYYTSNYVVPLYRASATLFISEEVSNVFSGVSTSDIALDSTLLIDYKELIETNMVANMVIEDLELDMSMGRLSSGVKMSSASESRFVYLSFVDSDPERAAMIANKYSEILDVQAREVIGADNVQIIDYAMIPRSPISPNITRNIMLGGLGGAAAAVCVVFLLFLLDDKVKNEQDVERLTKIPVLGVIPNFRGGRR